MRKTWDINAVDCEYCSAGVILNSEPYKQWITNYIDKLVLDFCSVACKDKWYEVHST